MILEMKVPSPGESIKEVEIATWLVKDGDYVEKDQAIAEVDSDKATLELPAEASGIITLKAEEGDAVAVGAIVCLIDTSLPNPSKGGASKPSPLTPEGGTASQAVEKVVEDKKEEVKASPVVAQNLPLGARGPIIYVFEPYKKTSPVGHFQRVGNPIQVQIVRILQIDQEL